MSRTTCREDWYEYRVRLIFQQLRKQYKDRIGASEVPFEEWIERNREEVGIAFLTDVESFMGIPDEQSL